MRARRGGVSIVEVLCALAFLGVGAAVLAAAVAGDRGLRLAADVRRASAERARDRLEAFAARSCAAGDTAGEVTRAWGVARWRARAQSDGWWITDSVASARAGSGLPWQALVACPD